MEFKSWGELHKLVLDENSYLTLGYKKAVEQARRVVIIKDHFAYFSIKTYVVGTH